MKFVARPMVVDAEFFDGTKESANRVAEFLRDRYYVVNIYETYIHAKNMSLSGHLHIFPGVYVMDGPGVSVSVVGKSDFEAKYEAQEVSV